MNTTNDQKSCTTCAVEFRREPAHANVPPDTCATCAGICHRCGEEVSEKQGTALDEYLSNSREPTQVAYLCESCEALVGQMTGDEQYNEVQTTS